MQEINILPGRVRLNIPEIHNNKALSRYLNAYLDNLYGVKFSKVTPYTASVLIEYDPHKTNLGLIEENLGKALYSAKVNKNADLSKYEPFFEAADKRSKAARNIALYGMAYLALRIKSSASGKYSFRSNAGLLKAAAIVTIVGGYPLLKRIYKKLLGKIPSSPDMLLNLSALSLTILRESSEGIMVLLLESLNDYVKLSAEVEGRRLFNRSVSHSAGMAWLCPEEDRRTLVSAESLKAGDIICVNSGELIPADGEVVDGKAVVNSLFHTGQPVVTHIESGSNVFEGISIINGKLKIRVGKPPESGSKPDFNEDMKLMKEVIGYQQFITPLSIAVSGLTYISSGSVLRALSVLLGLTPSASETALKTGLNSNICLLNKYKIYLRNPGVFEKLSKIDHIVFDKTGTLTQGIMKIQKVESFDERYPVRELLRISAACEVDNYHPIAITIQEEVVEDYDVSKVQSSALIPCKGIVAVYDNHNIIIGGKAIMEENNVDISAGMDKYTEYENKLFTTVFIGIDNKLAGLIVMEDILRENVSRLIKRLRQNGIGDISMITGDSADKANSLASRLEIKNVYSDSSCEDKQRILQQIKNRSTVMMVGDGVNDVLAMKEADISISFTNSACDKAKFHSDCLIFEDDITRLADLINLSKKSYGSIHHSIQASEIYNAVFGALALFNRFDAFTAKTINTLNTMMVLLLNKRIEFLSPGKFLTKLITGEGK